MLERAVIGLVHFEGAQVHHLFILPEAHPHELGAVDGAIGFFLVAGAGLEDEQEG